MKKLLNLALGIVTSIGGFVEAGSISTAVQAGSEFSLALLWAIAVATLMLAMIAEMSGRVAAVGKRSIAAAVRERFGFHFQFVPFAAECALDLLLLAAEIGGAAVAMKMLSGAAFQWWIIPVAALVWLLLWLAPLSVIEDGVGLLGMITLVFVVAAWRLEPSAASLARGLLPSLPNHGPARYAFLVVSIIGATVSPYLLNFYSSGALEEGWTADDLWINRATAFLGMGFGSVVSMGALVTSAQVLGPTGARVDSFEQAATIFMPVFGGWAVPLFALALGIGCFGAAVEITLNIGYLFAQSFGWSWGANRPRTEASRFTVAYSLVLAVAMSIALLGVDPLRVTLISVALTVIIMPIIVLPYLVLTNDEQYVGQHTSGPIGNAALAAVTIAGAIMAIVVVPLEFFGG